MPKQLDTALLKPGMVLAEPACNRQGQVLLQTGTVIEERHLMTLKTWGVAQVTVKAEGGSSSGDEKQSGGLSREALGRAISRLNQRWTWKPENSIEKEIYVLAVRRAAHLITSDDGKS